MRRLALLALVGLLAQLVDGSLGMGYGVTSSSSSRTRPGGAPPRSSGPPDAPVTRGDA